MVDYLKMNKNTLIKTITILFLITEIFIWGAYFLFCLKLNETISVQLQVIGGFAATFIAFSCTMFLDYRKKESDQKEDIKSLAVALNSELTVNVRKLENLLDGIEKTPKKRSQIKVIRSFFPMWVEQLESLKFDVFKGLLNSGDVKILTRDLELMAEINIAYYNMGLLIEKGHVISRLIFDNEFVKDKGDLQIEDLEANVSATYEVVKSAMDKVRKALVERKLYVFTDKKITKLRDLIQKEVKSKYNKS